MDKIWNPIPVYTAIIEILTKKGSLTDSDLLKELGKRYDDMNFKELNKTLFQLEIKGSIRVYRHLKIIN